MLQQSASIPGGSPPESRRTSASGSIGAAMDVKTYTSSKYEFGGLFVETARQGLGFHNQAVFLVQEGQIRASCCKRVDPGHGMALKFTAVSDQDCPPSKLIDKQAPPFV